MARHRSGDLRQGDWAVRYAKPLGSGKNRLEYSSLIYRNSDGTYGYTDPARFEDREKAIRASPGLFAKEHEPIPKGTELVGQIHLHWEGSESMSDYKGENESLFSAE